MKAKEIREKYLEFFKEKGHSVISSASLLPDNDPTTLFTGSGMQPMLPYLLGEEHPAGARITDSQKSFRALDIEDVGDNRHTTFFEMLGNWSLGDYFKNEQIEWIFDFLTKELKLDPNRLFVSVFRGDKKIGIARDDEAVGLWQERFESVGIDAKAVDMAEKKGMQGGRIFYYDAKENWWSRSGTPDVMPVGEPGGTDSEMFWDFGADLKIHENSPYSKQPCHPACDCGRFLEIGNNVFMEYLKTVDGFKSLESKNIDFGGGLERLTAAVLDNPDVFMTDLFEGIKIKLEELSGKRYGESDPNPTEDRPEGFRSDGQRETTNSFRIVMDHLRAATFIIGDDKGVTPSNTDQGYIVRRLIRRAIRYGKQLGITQELWTKEIAKVVIDDYKETYPELERNKEFILEQLDKEEIQFSKTLEKGLRELEKGIDPFVLFTTYGFPIEMTQEIAQEKRIKINLKDFEKRMKEHQELSRTASVGKFKGGLADNSVETTRLHTTAHLLLSALRKVLGNDVQQKGSNITAERLRFDFSYGEKMTDEQKLEVENLVNEAIQKDMPIICEETSLEDAKKSGAVGAFEAKYGERVKVYKIADGADVFSYEICGGPHINRTGELGQFKITKEESSSAGVRRIKAILS